jgi:tetratricopeptide (TPR) repeat protein
VNARLLVALVVVAVLAAAGTSLWLREARHARLRHGLPVLPGALPNPTLGDLLADARAEAALGRWEAVAELARLFHANEFRAEAETCWRLLIREQPGEARWHYYLADLLRMTGDQAAVEEQLALTVACDPGAATAWLQLAEMKFKSGRLDLAETDYRRRLELVPEDPYAELGLARLAQLRGRGDESLTRLKALIGRHPKFSAAQNLYAELQSAAGREDLADYHRWLGREAGRFREADDPWMEELNTRCHEPRRLCHLGVVAYQTNQGDRGRARFERAIALAPDNPLPFELLGNLVLEQGSVQEARELLERGINQATAATPTALHYVKLSEALDKLGQPEPARRALADGLRLHPSSAELLHAQGNRLKADGKIPEAAEAYRKALKLNPALVEADFDFADLLLKEGLEAEAIQALDHAMSMQPTFPKVLVMRAGLELRAGRIEGAGKYFLPLLKAHPGVPELRQIVTHWRWQAGRAAAKSNPASAERHYREGLALQPDHADLNVDLGALLLAANRVSEAVPPLETYYRLQPAKPEASLLLSQAYARTGRLPKAREVLTAGLQHAEKAGETAAAKQFREILSKLPR